MNKITNIHYTDAYYILEEGTKPSNKLPHNEAFGWIKETQNKNLAIRFIKEFDKNKNPNLIIKGLILPAGAILSRSKKGFLKGLNSLKSGQKISLFWQDVIFVENDNQLKCPTMYTEGVIFKNNSDHIILKNSETIRTEPLPIKNHPQIKPVYYVIPKSFIKSFESI